MLLNILSEVTEPTETAISWDWQAFLGKIFNWIQTSGVKLLIGVCKGKKLYDKRETIKERDIRRYESKMN